MAPSPAAGKTAGQPRTPTKLSRKPAGQAGSQQPQTPKAPQVQKPETDSPQLPPRPEAEDAKGKAEEATENVPEEASKVEMKDQSEADTEESIEPQGKISQAAGELEEQEPKPVEEEAEDTIAGAEEEEEDGDDATEKAGDTADDIEEEVEEEGEHEGEEANGVHEAGKDTLGVTSKLGKGDVSGAIGDVEDAAGEAKEGVEDEAGDAVEGAKDTAEEATGKELPHVADVSILKGLEVDEQGLIHDHDGNPIGKLVEGDAEDLAGYTIGDDGEILDDDGDLVGRCELLPEKAQQMLQEAKEKAEDAGEGVPGLEILEGLSCDATGQILNDDGDTIGQIVEGDPSELQGRPLNAQGEILDDEGNVIGRARVHPDVTADYGEEEGEEGEEEGGEEGKGLVDGVAGEAGEAVNGVPEGAEEAGEAIDEAAPELPGIEALEGHQVNEEGQVVDEEGNVLGDLAEGSVTRAAGMTINEKGEVIDDEGNVVGKVELAEGAAEQLAEAAEEAGEAAEEAGEEAEEVKEEGVVQLPVNDLRILEGLKVNKKGKILDAEGETIGELIDGDPKACAGKLVNAKGEVLDKEGKVIGRVKVVPGEASEEATRDLLERLGELEPQTKLPGLEILDGLKVNKKGKILNEDGEEIGELVDGDIAECAGKKANDQGEVLDSKGKVIGRVRTLPQQGEEEEVEEGEEAAEEVPEEFEEVAEEGGPELPPLSTLEGLKVNKAGKIVNDDGVIVGELIEGDAKKLSKSGITADAEGQFWDNKGHVIGRAQTVPIEEPDEEAPFAGLEGLLVNRDGMVEDENGNIVGQVTEGDPKKLVGRRVDEDGDIIDKKGTVVGHAERYEEPEAEPEPEPEAVDLSFLAGKTVNKQGNVIGDEGVPVARLVEGNPKELAGKRLDREGQLWNDQGQVIGRVELIPENEREAKPEGPFAGLVGLRVVQDGKIADEDDNIVGQIVEGNPKRLVGLAVDEDGDIIDKYGNVKGHAEPLLEEEEEVPDLSILENKILNKQGLVVGEDGIPLGRLVEGNVKELAGRRCDDQGLIHNDTGKVVGRCELIPENERVAKPEGPFAGFEGLRVVKDGKIEDEDGNVVGVLVEGNPKRLIGHAVDEDGDIIDKYGNVKGHAEPYEEEEEAPIDLSALAGCTVNKAGNIVDSSGQILGRVAEGDLKNLIGRKVDGQGQIWDNAGNVIGRAELVQGADKAAEGPFAGFDDITVAKDGTVVTPNGDIVGRIVEGDVKKLVGHKVDEDGDINDKNGNTIGKAERWEPEEKERRINPMSGHRVNKEGEVRDENGELIGRLTAGDLGHCVGFEVDDNGYVIDNDGNKIGECTLIENIVEEEEEEEEGPTEEELQRQKDAELADKMANICQQTLERVQPVCKQITEYIEQADRTPRDELDEEELVNNVKPLIEEGGRILQECNGALRGLDPDGRIAAQAKGRAGTREATPEEYRLADLLKELTTTVVTTIDNAKKKIQDMPHAKKKLNPLWGLLTEPLFQIIAAVGLLLAGVLGLVGRLLNGLGLGGLVNGLLGGLGIDKLLGGLGLGSITEALGGGKKKKKKAGGGASGLPLVGGLFGGK